MSPEQVRGQALDARSDLFLLGVVLYELLAGKQPFTGESVADVQSAIIGADPPELLPASLRVPPALERLLRRCLEKSPTRRFQSATDLVYALDEVGAQLTSSSAAPWPTPPEPAQELRARFGIWRIAATALLAALIGAAAMQVIGRQARATGTSAAVLRFELAAAPDQPFYVGGAGRSIAIAPDGKQLALIVEFGGTTRIALRRVGQLEQELIPGADEVTRLTFSPESDAIAYLSRGRL